MAASAVPVAIRRTSRVRAGRGVALDEATDSEDEDDDDGEARVSVPQIRFAKLRLIV